MGGFGLPIIMKYKCERSGSTEHNGQRLKYRKGTYDYPPGSLGHVASCTMIGKQKTTVVSEANVRTVNPKPLDGTIPEIKDWLDKNDVEYSSTARKPELLEILENA